MRARWSYQRVPTDSGWYGCFRSGVADTHKTGNAVLKFHSLFAVGAVPSAGKSFHFSIVRMAANVLTKSLRMGCLCLPPVPAEEKMRKSLLAIGALCLLLLPASAMADQITTFSFTGSTVNGTVTGTYSLDLTIDSIVGPWSFLGPFDLGFPPDTISSADSAASAFFTESESIANAPPGFDILNFTGFTPLFGTQVQVQLIFNDPQDGGDIVPFFLDSNGGAFISLFLANGSLENNIFTSGSSTVVTPEPSSVALLLAGIGFLLVLMRKRLAQGLQQAT